MQLVQIQNAHSFEGSETRQERHLEVLLTLIVLHIQLLRNTVDKIAAHTTSLSLAKKLYIIIAHLIILN